MKYTHKDFDFCEINFRKKNYKVRMAKGTPTSRPFCDYPFLEHGDGGRRGVADRTDV